MSSEYNGYLDSDQTIIDFFVNEMDGSFADLMLQNPSRSLRQWWKCRKSAQGTAVGTATMGAIALVGGVVVGAPLLLGGGVFVAAVSGWMVKLHGEGAAAHKLEREMLDKCPILIPFLVNLEAAGIHRAELVSAYNDFMRAAMAGAIDPTEQQQVKGWFQVKLEQRSIFAQAASGFTAAASPASPAPTPAALDQLAAEAEREMQIGFDARLATAPPETLTPPAGDLPLQPPPATTPTPESGHNPHTYDIRSIGSTGYVESILWIGASQSGKTTTADQLGREYRQIYGDKLRAYYVTPVNRSKGDNDERSLFDWCDSVIRVPLLNEIDAYTITDAYEAFEQLLDGFLGLESDRAHPKLFIADELTLHAQFAGINNKLDPIGNKAARLFFGKLVNAINANASGGKAEGIGLWGIAPSGAVNAIGLNKAAMSTATAVFVGNLKHWNGGVYDGARRNALAPTLPPDRALMSYCDRHSLDRVVSVSGGDWQPLAVYDVPRPTRNEIETARNELEKRFEQSETVETPSLTPSPASNPDDISTSISDFESGETTDFDPDRVRRVLEMRRNEMNQTQIISIEWGVKPGESKAYKDAVAQYKAILDRYGKGEK